MNDKGLTPHTLVPLMTPDQLAVIRTYLHPDRALSPKSAEAIETVLRAAYDQLAEQGEPVPTFYVKATVSAYIDAPNLAAALQELCDRLAHGVPDQYGVNTVDGQEVEAHAK